MAATILAWLVYGAFVALRPTGRSARAPRAGRLRRRDRRPHRARREPLLKLSLVGISHHVAPVELRERVALPLERAAALARELGDAVCLSTCNRTELYLAGERDEHALATLEQIAGEPLGPVAYRMHDEAAAVHLFRVSAGLDSLVPGESEILGQVKAAYEAATAGPLLDRVFRQALQLGKRVRSETAIGESPASVPSAAAALAEQVFGDLARPSRAVDRRRSDRRARSRQPLGTRRVDRLRRQPQRRGCAVAGDALRRRSRSQGDSSPRSSARSTSCSPRRARRSSSCVPGDVPSRAPPAAVLHRHRRPARRRSGGARAGRLLPLRHRRPRGRRRRDDRRPPRRGRAGRGDRRPRRRRASASGRRRSRSCRRSPRCAPAPRRFARPSSRSSATCPSTSAARSSR